MPVRYGGATNPNLRYGGVNYANVRYGGVTYPLLGRLWTAIRARTDTLTAAQFNTAALSQAMKYRSWPDQALTGEVLAEYIATDQDGVVPLVRGFETTSNGHLNLRQRVGDNTARGGIEALGRTWSDWLTILLGLHGTNEAIPHRVYFLDVTNEEYFTLRPGVREGGSAGGSFINWTITDTFGLDLTKTTFADVPAWRTWLDAIRLDTTPRECIVAILESDIYAPDFTA